MPGIFTHFRSLASGGRICSPAMELKKGIFRSQKRRRHNTFRQGRFSVRLVLAILTKFERQTVKM